MIFLANVSHSEEHTFIMCGRFFIDFEDRNIQNLLHGLKPNDTRFSSGDVYPSATVPVLAQNTTPLFARCGYERSDKKGLLINARAETVTQKPTFRKDFFERRCLIPANGFYEWTENKQKVFFRREDRLPLLLGGIFRNEKSGGTSFVILTKEATPPVDTFHDRIPILVEPNDLEKWLCDISFAADILSMPSEQLLFPVTV